MKRFRVSVSLLSVVVFLVMAMSLSALAAEAPGIIEVTALAETLEEGQKVTAVVIEYSEPIACEAIASGSFSVAGRSITRVYVNDSGEKGDVKTRGRFVVIELAVDPTPGNSVGNTLLYANGRNERLPIHLSIVQRVNIQTIAGNTILPSGFTNTAERNLEVDGRFQALSYTNPETGTVLNYRLFVPEGDLDEPLPLVVFLHGAGERGDNNISQLVANRSALEWATPEAQAENPCFVLAPQCPSDTAWTANTGTAEEPVYETSYALKNVKAVIDQLIEQYNIDTARIYGTGLSMGSRGTYIMSLENPDLYAAQLNLCSADVYPDSQVAGIVDKPIWAIVAADDADRPENKRHLMNQLERLGATVCRQIHDRGWNGFLRGAEAEAQAEEQITEAEWAGANVLYTEYIAGTVVPSAHWSWMAAYANSAVRQWLFSHVSDTPYQPK
ncbi:MAG: hypothetical protein GX030_07720 [Firmicutes bacterium]|nr:hypothetical protein [Bacillota bacterium]